MLSTSCWSGLSFSAAPGHAAPPAPGGGIAGGKLRELSTHCVQARTSSLNCGSEHKGKICSPAWGKHPSAEKPALYLREGLAGPPRRQQRGLTHHAGAGAGCAQGENEQGRCHTSIIMGLMTPWHDSLAIHKYTHIHIYNM